MFDYGSFTCTSATEDNSDTVVNTGDHSVDCGYTADPVGDGAIGSYSVAAEEPDVTASDSNSLGTDGSDSRCKSW